MRNDLIEAYIGRREDDHEFLRRYETYKTFMVEQGWKTIPSYHDWMVGQVTPLIEQASPRDRLEEYLEWNGIVGYTGAIYAIATEET